MSIEQMTDIPGVPNKVRQAMPGMAHFAGTGPRDQTCGKCAHIRDSRCEMFRTLIGRPGPRISRSYDACKYWEEPPKEDLRTPPQPISKVPPT